MLSNRLLQLVIDGKKIIIVIFSKRKKNLGFVVKKYCECCTSKKNKSLISKLLLVLI